MKILKYILLLALLLVVAGAIYVATLKNSYEVSRTKVIKAPQSVVFNNINELKNWPAWSPWLEKDSLTVLTYGATSSGEGASYTWKSDNKEVGEGSMEIVRVNSPDSILQKIKFVIPWESESDIYWAFKAVDNSNTEVTWGMKGELGFMEKAFMALGGGMDKQIGPDFETGLANLDKVVQADMKKYSIEVNGLTTHGGGYYLYNSTSCKIDEMESIMPKMMTAVSEYVEKNKIPLAGAPFSMYHKFDPENNAVIFSCAVPVTERVITANDSGIQTGLMQPFKAVKTTLKGDYSNLKEAWETSYKYLTDNNLQGIENSPTLELYHTEPKTTINPAEWLTELYLPVKE